MPERPQGQWAAAVRVCERRRNARMSAADLAAARAAQRRTGCRRASLEHLGIIPLLLRLLLDAEKEITARRGLALRATEANGQFSCTAARPQMHATPMHQCKRIADVIFSTLHLPPRPEPSLIRSRPFADTEGWAEAPFNNKITRNCGGRSTRCLHGTRGASLGMRRPAWHRTPYAT